MDPCARLLVPVLALQFAAAALAADPGVAEPAVNHALMTDEMPGSELQLDRRLVLAGESVTFSLREATPEDRFEIFPRYLERCDAERARQSSAPLQWLDDLDRETLPATKTISYVPRQPGNYLARWTGMASVASKCNTL